MSAASQAVETIAEALNTGAFDPQHAGEVFLRADGERAIRAALGEKARMTVAGKGDVRSAGFLGARFAPDLVVEPEANQRIAVTITLLRGDAGPVTTALANALVLAPRYAAVVAFILDRRLAKRNPFDDPKDEPAQRNLTELETAFIADLWQRYRIRIVVRRQDPFGWE